MKPAWVSFLAAQAFAVACAALLLSFPIYSVPAWGAEPWDRTHVVNGRIYLTSFSGITVVDASTRSLIAKVRIRDFVRDITFAPDRSKAYVGAARRGPDFISVIDLKLNQIIDRIDFRDVGQLEVDIQSLAQGQFGRLYVVVNLQGVPVLKVIVPKTKQEVLSLILARLPVKDSAEPPVRTITSIHTHLYETKVFLFDASMLSFLVVDVR